MTTFTENLYSREVRERYFTAQQVAERLQVNEQTVRRWLRSGELHGVRLAGSWRITETDLKAFLDARRADDN